MEKLQIRLLPNSFGVKEDGTYDLEGALLFSGKMAGICYQEDGFDALNQEEEKKSLGRANGTIRSGHHSVFGHAPVGLEITNLPKILAMMLNNEHDYNTSEKSARYTILKVGDNSLVTKEEVRLYNKWLTIFEDIITKEYGSVFTEWETKKQQINPKKKAPAEFAKTKIHKLAQENARYMVSVLMPTSMAYTTNLRQINYIGAWLLEEVKNPSNELVKQAIPSIKEFIAELDRLHVLDERLMHNEKHRRLSLFTDSINDVNYFGNVYDTTYKGSFAQYAQAHRHRTLDYKMQLLEPKEFYVPQILLTHPQLAQEWLEDISSIGHVYPQGELVLINEQGSYANFILKCKERLCSAAQLEINHQTKETLMEMKKFLENTNHPLKDDVSKYTKGARCTFPDFECNDDCFFKEGKTLQRRV